MTLDELKNVKEGSYIGEVLPEQAALLAIKPLELKRSVLDVLPDILEKVAYDRISLVPWYGREA